MEERKRKGRREERTKEMVRQFPKLREEKKVNPRDCKYFWTFKKDSL